MRYRTILLLILVTCSMRDNTALHQAPSTHNRVPLDDPGQKAYEQQSPHAPCHFRPTHPATPSNHKGPVKKRRFFEGWYYRITLPENGASFAFIFSIEDPFEGSKLSLACHQIMGPNDEYLVQADSDHTKFWAWDGQQALGCTFEVADDQRSSDCTRTVVPPDEYHDTVKSGFQMLPTRLQGKLVGHDGSLGGIHAGQGIEGECEYDIHIDPITGWGDETVGQKSTAGWLASYQVFEPHWQVTLSDARATGMVRWKGKEYKFEDIPFYAEKNWGGSFPIRWYWCQCNSFDGYIGSDKTNHLSVTAGGGTRKIPLSQTESLGMVSVHHQGRFYEATPWLGEMKWRISPWGTWIMSGHCTGGLRPFDVELEAICDAAGVVLRAPTETDGMEYFCRDSFLAKVTLSLWELDYDKATNEYKRGKLVIDNATSAQGAVEVGGGPWWYDWTAKSKMKQPMKSLVRLPYRLASLKQRLFTRRRKNK